ncbi:hypothetical protein [Cytobacillus oceanisediminis]|uniref:Uncharacterized protein n=1 Tax=Cytobacillus oceanisediminis 2691 TaxID=1196031 RepID=A0A160MEC2_9BACI|nr:hypothetical protein [Cytobacillus oceanisediminis]AND41482.1 hypothetical protein A361_20725 [Cytobacillus oceanisediminis 2691]
MNFLMGILYVAICFIIIFLSYKTLAELIKSQQKYTIGVIIGIILFLGAIWWGAFTSSPIPKYFTVIFTVITFAWSLIELSGCIEEEQKRNRWQGVTKVLFGIVVVGLVILLAEGKHLIENFDTSVLETIAFSIFIMLFGLKK